MTARRLLLGVMLTLLASTGCMDLEDIDSRAFITALGIDAAEGGRLTMTAQFPQPNKMLPPGSPSSGGAPGKKFTLAQVTANSVNSAFRQLQSVVPADVTLFQNKVIIFGTELCRKGMGPACAFFGRSTTSPPQAFFFVARNGKASEILEMEPDAQMLPAVLLLLAAQAKEKADRTYFIPIWKFRQLNAYETTDAYAPLIEIDKKEKRYVISGLAAFKDDRFVAELSPEETQMFGLITGKMRSGHLEFPHSGGGWAVLSSVAAGSRVRISMKGAAPFFEVRVRVIGALTEMTGKRFELAGSRVDQIEEELARYLRPRLTGVIRKLQSANSDIIDFGEQLRVQKPAAWKGKPAWRETFPGVPFQVSVSVKIRRDGIRR